MQRPCELSQVPRKASCGSGAPMIDTDEDQRGHGTCHEVERYGSPPGLGTWQDTRTIATSASGLDVCHMSPLSTVLPVFFPRPMKTAPFTRVSRNVHGQLNAFTGSSNVHEHMNPCRPHVLYTEPPRHRSLSLREITLNGWAGTLAIRRATLQNACRRIRAGCEY